MPLTMASACEGSGTLSSSNPPLYPVAGSTFMVVNPCTRRRRPRRVSVTQRWPPWSLERSASKVQNPGAFVVF